MERAYPTLQPEAQELLALNRFLDAIKDPQLAFGVRQRTPANLDQAVAATLELDMYLLKSLMTVSGVTPIHNDRITAAYDDSIAATSAKPSSVESALQTLIKRIDKLEGKLVTEQDTPHNCQQPGHFARNCPAKKDQENEQPSEQ